MEILTYVYEVLFFALGVYLLLFSMGKFKSKNTAKQQRIDEYRKNTQPWLKILGIALILIYGMILLLHIL